METGTVEIIIKGGKIPGRDITFSLVIFPLFLQAGHSFLNYGEYPKVCVNLQTDVR